VKRIESLQNPLLKRASRLQKPGSREIDGVLVEGDKLIREALQSGAGWSACSSRKAARRRGKPTNPCLPSSPPSAAPFVPARGPPHGHRPVRRSARSDLDGLLAASQTLVVLDRVQDPGNLGTIIRSCEGLGAGGLLLLKGCCSPHNPKVIRAAMGSSFRVPVVTDLDGSTVLATLQRLGFVCLATSRQGDDLRTTPLPRRCALFFGAEGAGLAPELLTGCDRRLAIPMVGPAESFNVAIATAICLYERLRQAPPA